MGQGLYPSYHSAQAIVLSQHIPEIKPIAAFCVHLVYKFKEMKKKRKCEHS